VIRGITEIGKGKVACPFTSQKSFHADPVLERRYFRFGQDTFDGFPSDLIGLKFGQFGLQRFVKDGYAVQVLTGDRFGTLFVALVHDLFQDGK